jgi:vitamin B12 transporter
VEEFILKSALTIWAGALALVMAGACAEGADTPAAAADADSGGEIVVTATRTRTDSDELAVPVIVITRAEIERSLAGDVAELLAGHSGVEIARTGGPGQPSSIFLSGTDSDHTTVLLDGVRINPGTIGGAALQNIQPESIERIEIIKGARSSLYGTDAVGGVVNIITRAGAASGASVYGSVGRYGTEVLAADAGGHLTDQLAAGGSLAYQRSDGFPPRRDASDPGDYRNTSANAQLRYAASDALGLRAQLWRAEGKSAYSDFGTAASENFLDANYAVGADWSGAGGRTAHATVSRVTADVVQRESADFDRTRRDTLDAQYGWRATAANELTVGAVASSEHTESLSGSALGFPTQYDVHTHALLAYAQDQLHSGANDLLLALGYTHHETFGSRGTGNLEYVRSVTPALRATAAFGTAFHAPDSTDRFGFGGNPDLQPERSRQGQLGLRWAVRTQELRLSASENRIDGLIQYVLLTPATCVPPLFICTYQAQNVESARIRGAEAEYHWHSGPWQLRASYSIQDPRNLTTGEMLLRRARHNALASALYEAGRFSADAELQLAGPRIDFGPVPLGGYTLLNVGCRYELAPGWSAQLRVDNALDRRYELASGYNTPGRALTLAMRYHMR